MKTLLMILVVGMYGNLALADAAQPCAAGVACKSNQTNNFYCDSQPKIVYRTKVKVVEKLVKAPALKVIQYVEKPVIQRVVVEKSYIEKRPRNSLSIMAGRSQTGLQLINPFTAHTVGEFDVGIMYQRDLGKHFRLSIMGTKNANAYGGIGYDF